MAAINKLGEEITIVPALKSGKKRIIMQTQQSMVDDSNATIMVND